MHCNSTWKPHQDAVHWIHLARAQEKGLQFWQTRSHATVVGDSVLADGIDKVARHARRQNLISETFHASSSSEEKFSEISENLKQQQDSQSSTG